MGGLVLNVRKGEKIYIDDDWIRIPVVTGQQQFVCENSDGTAYTVDGGDCDRQEVIPEVFVRAGRLRTDMPGMTARVYIEAPLDMKILREAPYETLQLHLESRYFLSLLWNRDPEKLADGEEEEVKLVMADLADEIERLSRGGKR